jgi:hypothetical protein
MSALHHFPFTRRFLEACTDLKLIELRDSLLREPLEDRRDDRHAVAEELEKRQKEALMSGVDAVTLPSAVRPQKF